MSRYTPITLVGKIQSQTGIKTYKEKDGTGLEDQFQTFKVVVDGISPQLTGDESTREQNQYNGLDINAGMFLSDTTGEVIFKITDIQDKNQSSFEAIVKDENMLSYRLNNKNTINQNDNVIIFDVNPEGEALIFDNSNFQDGAVDLVQSRFQIDEQDDRVKFENETPSSVDVGDVVSIDNQGKLVQFGDPSQATPIKVGSVVETLRNKKDIFLKPFNDIIRDYKFPEKLTGNPGDKYFTDKNSPGNITLTPGGKEIYLQLNTPIPTEMNTTTGDVPTSSDVVVINDVKVFDGPGGDSVLNVGEFSSLINNFTSQTKVSSTTGIIPVSVDSEDNNPIYESQDYFSSDVFIATGEVGGDQTFGKITISDKINPAVEIIFDNPDTTAMIEGETYNIISPSNILSKINTSISENSLELEAELFEMGKFDGQGIRITTKGNAGGIELINIENGSFGVPIVGNGSWTGLGIEATTGPEVLQLTRQSGGPIVIDGSPSQGGFINSNGMVSSKNGRVPFLLLIESSGDVNEVGVEFEDADLTPNITSEDNDPTGVSITNTPFSGSNVRVLVNGLGVNIGNGVKTKDCYFSSDQGVTPKQISNITSGDELYWNGSIAGFQLDGGDLIDIVYDASSNDV